MMDEPGHEQAQQPKEQEQAEESAKAPRARTAWKAAGILLMAAAVFGGWLAFSGTWKAWGAVATIDGKRIVRADLEQHMEFLVRQGRIRPDALTDPARRKEAERAALDDLITRRVLLVEAERLKIVVGPGEEDVAFRTAHGGQPGEFKLADVAKKKGEDVDRLREEVRGQLLMTRLAEKVTEDVKVGDEDAAEYYEAHRQSFTAPGEAHLRLLIVDSKEDAEKLRAQALKGADFAALVREYGKGGGKARGGDMGWVDSRMLPAAIAKAVDAIPQTGVTPVIEAKGGFYVLRVDGRRPPRQVPLAEVKDQLVQMVLAQRKQAKFAEWLGERRRAAKIEIYL
jgi:parvulin-like peptidyl-prolyl isomerase